MKNLIHDMPQQFSEMYASVEKKMTAKFVGEFDFNNMDVHIPVFYTKEPHPEGSHYFALYHTSWFPSPLDNNVEDVGHWMICNAGKIEDFTWCGFDLPEGILYSRSVHDYRTKNGYMVDGGYDYFKYSVPEPQLFKAVNFKIKDGEVVVINADSE